MWQETRTFFPLFVDALQEREAQRVAVVGAADGKFVLPLADLGYDVVAIERDQVAVDGGVIHHPGGTRQWLVPGLRHRLDVESLTDRVDIRTSDLFDVGRLAACDAVWTSCSWHYSANHGRPLQAFIDAMMAMLPRGGLFGAEYMMPVEPRHWAIEHYLRAGQIRRYLRGATPWWDVTTAPFNEAPHPEQPESHTHQMGFVLAELPAASNR